MTKGCKKMSKIEWKPSKWIRQGVQNGYYAGLLPNQDLAFHEELKCAQMKWLYRENVQ